MRPKPGELPELIDAYQRDGLYFASIRLARAGRDNVFELGISANSYAALRRVFQTHPFDQMPGLRHRYFFTPIHSRGKDPERCKGTIRVELGREGKQVSVELPKSLIANLLWFHEMKNLDAAKHLRSWDPDPERG